MKIEIRGQHPVHRHQLIEPAAIAALHQNLNPLQQMTRSTNQHQHMATDLNLERQMRR